MKQPYSFKTWHSLISMLFVMMCCLPETVAAQVSFSDDFNYPAGNLHEQGGWVRYGKNAEDPIQVLDKQLTYAGYNDNAPAKCVKIGSAKQGEDLMVKFTDNADGVKSGNLYFSALINVEAQPKGNVYVMSFVPRTKASEIAEGIAPTELGRLYIGEGDNADEVKVGIERGANNPVFATSPLKLNQTYLVVLRYEINAANPRQDNIYLYVNPTDFKQEPKLNMASAVIDGVNKTGSGLGSYGLQGLELRQGTTSSVTSPEMYVASVRVSDTYAGLFGEAGVDTTPKLGVSKKTFVLGEVYSGDTHEETVKVTGENLTGDITVESSSEAVSVEPATIAADDAMSAGGAELKIKVTYTDGEQNPPTITLNPQKLEKFEAKINEKSEQTIEVTTANMPDYTYVKVKDAGAFVLNNTMLIRNMKNTLKVTFQPKKEGTYSTALVFSALGMEDVEVAIEGVATGETPEEQKEGVDLVLSEENALSVLDEKFDNIERNKPLDIEGWTNSALKGTRAWWGFSFLDYDAESPNEKVAKVTPYDSKMEAGTGTSAQMMLVTPPLDFKNSTTKVFTFKVRGDYLKDNQPDLLELCYIDIAEGSLYVQPLAECKMPCTKDESGKWFPYSIDLTGQQIADVFFMGFRFTSTRGCDNTATYYIDDVTYGIETTAIQTVTTAEKARLMVYNLAGSKVAEKSGSSVEDALRGLPHGIYIVKAVSADGVHTSKVQVK